MSGLNKVMLIGNLGKDPEYRHMEGGVMTARFPLATTEYYKNKEGNKEEKTEWHRIIMWTKKITLVGSLVCVTVSC